jgi:prevent-host-death family protein
VAVVTVHQAKTQLSKLIARAEAGEEIVIARGSQPTVKLTPVGKKAPIWLYEGLNTTCPTPSSSIHFPRTS